VASPREIYERPATRFVATFVGSPRMNLFPCVREGSVLRCGALALPAPSSSLPSAVDVGVRPEHLRVVDDGAADGPFLARGELLAVEPLGAETHLTARVGDERIRARLPGFVARRPGERVTFSLDAPLHLFDHDTGARLS
jgi:multiple sugar transport system ATP-binding protein